MLSRTKNREEGTTAPNHFCSSLLEPGCRSPGPSARRPSPTTRRLQKAAFARAGG